MSCYERHSIHTVDTILPLIDQSQYIWTKNVFVPITSVRLRVYRHKGVACIACGIVGTYFAVERNKNQRTDRWHLNLYCENDRMMSVDHIIPKAKGGPRSFVNLQPMCFPCNNRKGDRLITTPAWAI